MAERLIGSLIYGEHPEPKKARLWKDRLKVPAALFLLLVVVGGLLYTFVNYREESRVQLFLDTVVNGRYEEAYAMWDGHERYQLEHFLEDWGADGYYSTGQEQMRVVDSNGRGGSVIVYAQSADPVPVAIMVDKETLLLSFSPENKYQAR